MALSFHGHPLKAGGRWVGSLSWMRFPVPFLLDQPVSDSPDLCSTVHRNFDPTKAHSTFHFLRANINFTLTLKSYELSEM